MFSNVESWPLEDYIYLANNFGQFFVQLLVDSPAGGAQRDVHAWLVQLFCRGRAIASGVCFSSVFFAPYFKTENITMFSILVPLMGKRNSDRQVPCRRTSDVAKSWSFCSFTQTVYKVGQMKHFGLPNGAENYSGLCVFSCESNVDIFWVNAPRLLREWASFV